MSIRRYLSLILIALITLIIFFATVKGYQASSTKAQKLFDIQLQSLALILENMPLEQQSDISKDTPNFALQLWHGNRLMTKTASAPRAIMAPLKQRFSDQNFNGQRWRVWTKKLTDKRWIMVAQPLSLRIELTEEVILAAVVPIIISIPILALLISLTLRQGLSPLTQLATLLTNKKANDLSHIALTDQPLELTPVIERLNNLFERLDSAFKREKHFASDAAHELRTPLSILKINLHNLCQESPSSESLNNLTLGVERMSNIVDQILVLNRTNPQQFSYQFIPVNLNQLCQKSISDLYPHISNKHQTIELISKEIIINGDVTALEILMQNLIGNANKYTPHGGKIIVSINQVQQQTQLIIEDSGPGIPNDQRQRVFDRFYRVDGDQHHSNVVGCGLGLAITAHIVNLHHATITLGVSNTLGGLQVTVSFLAQASNTSTLEALS